ncbi:MAG: HEAT repeat domain-containing protein [Chloroflexi bacterium]|nr:HEAT repeat domain-containing protein [Chloroflexota bacterium]
MAKKLTKNGYDFDFDNDIDDDKGLDEIRLRPFPIAETVLALQNTEHSEAVLPAGAIYGLSDLVDESVAILRKVWPEIPAMQRRRTAKLLTEVSETNFDLDFEAFSYLAFEDDDPEVRAEGVAMTWYVGSERMYHHLMSLVRDNVPLVRAAAVEGLGRFIRDGELEEFDGRLAEQAQKVVLARYDDLREDDEVRRRALEAISFCTHPRLPDLIYEAYYSDDLLMKASAIFAMGSSCDVRWKDIIMKELDNREPEIRFEAVRGAGQLELAGSVRRLIELAYEDDYEIRLMAVWAMGEIGSKEAREALAEIMELADQNEDDELAEAAEEALGMASLVGEQFFPLFNLEDDLEGVDDFEYAFDDDFDELGELDEFEDDDELDSNDWASLN